LAFLVVYFLINTTLKDPGFLPQGQDSPETKQLILDLVENNSLNRHSFCATCLVYLSFFFFLFITTKIKIKVKRPLRSKHDRETNRCCALFDHYCPWVYTSVGYKNHRNFFVFLSAATLAQGLYAILGIICIFSFPFSFSFFFSFFKNSINFCFFF